MRIIERWVSLALDSVKIFLLRVSTFFDRSARRLKEVLKLESNLSAVDQVVSGRGGRLFSALLSPFLKAWGAIENAFKAIRKHPFVKWLFRTTYYLWYPGFALIAFAGLYIKTRKRATWVGVGVLAVAVGVGFVSLRWINRSQTGLSERYRNAMIEQMTQGNINEASIYKARLLTLGLRETDFEMTQINQLVEAGKLDEAIAFAESIAPIDQPGFADAHFWLAQQLLQGKSKLSPEESLRLAEVHIRNLKQSLSNDGLNPEQNILPAVTFVQAQIAFRQNRIAEGLKLLELIPRFPAAAIPLMRWNLDKSDHAKALRYALLLYEEVQQDPKALSNLNEEAFSIWCAALASGGDQPELVAALNYWRQQFPNNEFIQEETASMRLLQVDTLLSRGSSSDIARAAELLDEAMRDLPLSSHTLISNWTTSRLLPKGQNPAFEKAVELAVAKADAPSMLLEIAATAMAWEQDYQGARELFQRATAANPKNAMAWNGLALMELQFDRLAEAMDCANKAVEHGQRNAVFLRTRGLIAAKQEQWEQVIADLKQVVAENPMSKHDHLNLAAAYQAVGNQTLFELHQSLSKN